MAIYPALTDGKSVVTLQSTNGWIMIPFSKVVYLEAKDKKTFIDSEELSGTHKYSLQEFEYLLPKLNKGGKPLRWFPFKMFRLV